MTNERKIIKVDQMAFLLKKYRTEKGITLDQISELSGISINEISYFEENKRPIKLNTSELRNILHVLNLNEIEFNYGNLVPEKSQDRNRIDEFLESVWEDEGRDCLTKTIIFGFLEFKFRIYNHYSTETITKPWYNEFWLTMVDSENAHKKFIFCEDGNNPISTEEILKLADGIIVDTLGKLVEKLKTK